MGGLWGRIQHAFNPSHFDINGNKPGSVGRAGQVSGASPAGSAAPTGSVSSPSVFSPSPTGEAQGRKELSILNRAGGGGQQSEKVQQLQSKVQTLQGEAQSARSTADGLRPAVLEANKGVSEAESNLSKLGPKPDDEDKVGEWEQQKTELENALQQAKDAQVKAQQEYDNAEDAAILKEQELQDAQNELSAAENEADSVQDTNAPWSGAEQFATADEAHAFAETEANAALTDLATTDENGKTVQPQSVSEGITNMTSGEGVDLSKCSADVKAAITTGQFPSPDKVSDEQFAAELKKAGLDDAQAQKMVSARQHNNASFNAEQDAHNLEARANKAEDAAKKDEYGCWKHGTEGTGDELGKTSANCRILQQALAKDPDNKVLQQRLQEEQDLRTALKTGQNVEDVTASRIANESRAALSDERIDNMGSKYPNTDNSQAKAHIHDKLNKADADYKSGKISREEYQKILDQQEALVRVSDNESLSLAQAEKDIANERAGKTGSAGSGSDGAVSGQPDVPTRDGARVKTLNGGTEQLRANDGAVSGAVSGASVSGSSSTGSAGSTKEAGSTGSAGDGSHVSTPLNIIVPSDPKKIDSERQKLENNVSNAKGTIAKHQAQQALDMFNRQVEIQQHNENKYKPQNDHDKQLVNNITEYQQGGVGKFGASADAYDKTPILDANNQPILKKDGSPYTIRERAQNSLDELEGRVPRHDLAD